MTESQLTGIQTDPGAQYTQLTRATHETLVYLHEFPCGTPREKVEAKDGPPHMKKRIAQMILHRDWLASMIGSTWTATGRVHPNRSL